MRWLLHAFLQGLLNPSYGNVVFSRSKLHARHKSLVFFPFTVAPSCRQSLVLMYFLHVLYIHALEGFGGFRSLWEVWKAFGRFSEALKGFGKLWCKHGMSLTGFVDQSCWMHLYRVCCNLPMGMSCFLVLFRSRVLTAGANIMFCVCVPGKGHGPRVLL